MKTKTLGILTLVLVSAMIGASVYYHSTAPEPYYNYISYDGKDIKGSTIGVTLIVEHKDYLGRLKGTTIKENDYFLNNMAFFIKRLFTGNIVYTDNSLKPVATDGVSEIIWYNGDNGNIRHTTSSGKIGYGTGVTAVSLSDYELGVLVSSQSIGSIGKVASGTQVNATYTTTFSISGTHAVSEFGIYTTYFHDNGGAGKDFLLCRDVISPVINVVAGDSITVTYVWQYN